MISAGQFRVLALGAAFALGLGSAAQARSHAGAAVSHTSGHTGLSPFAGHGGHHVTQIAFSTTRHDRFGGRDVAAFGGRHAGRMHGGFSRYASGGGHSGGGIQCVTFARADTGIELSGNASAWWYNAAGVYQRGARPESGAVLNFRANGAMRMGHVAVVNEVLNSRTIDIDHANWGGPGAVRGGISRDIQVVDVSPNNDWSAVRVALGHSGEFGSVYPTYGFIYNRPDAGAMVAANGGGAPLPSMNPPPRDLRGSVRDTVAYDEVAEAPDGAEPSYSRHYSSRRGRHASLRGHSTRHALLATTYHHRHSHA